VNISDRNLTPAKVERRRAARRERRALSESTRHCRHAYSIDGVGREDYADQGEALQAGEEMQCLKELKARMLTAPDQQVLLTDPESRSMATSGRGSGAVGRGRAT
jgi:hypothetical protein